jgi:DNA invertase Pin-like site-specific DNA recombinase
VAITSQVASSPISAAQYVRMSDEAQRYSIENQKVAIHENAARHGFVVVKTYADAGKSGLVAKYRTALHELLKTLLLATPNTKLFWSMT